MAEYAYDGQGRRILKGVDDDADGQIDNSGGDGFTHFFHSGAQVIETRDATSSATAPESLAPTYQNVWSPRYVDSLILRDEFWGRHTQLWTAGGNASRKRGGSIGSAGRNPT